MSVKVLSGQVEMGTNHERVQGEVLEVSVPGKNVGVGR